MCPVLGGLVDAVGAQRLPFGLAVYGEGVIVLQATDWGILRLHQVEYLYVLL